MFRWKNYILLATLVCGIAFHGTCKAEVDCLQYPIYCDDEGNYLFIVDEYTSNNMCETGFVGEYYMWVPTSPPHYCPACPEVCGSCTDRSYLASNNTDRALRNNQQTSVLRSNAGTPRDMPFGDLLTRTYKFGKSKSNVDLPTRDLRGGSTFNPSAGITLLSSSWVKVQTASATPTLINVKLFTAQIDFVAAGLGRSATPTKPTRIIRVGFEMTGEEVPATPVYTPSRNANDERKYNGMINVKVDDDHYNFHVVSKTPLF